MAVDILQTANATLTAVSKAIDYVKNNIVGHIHDSSLTEVTKLTRAEPLTIISQDCSNLEYLPDVLNVVASIYSGYFLQAVAMLTTVNNIEVVRILDRLNPDRDSTGFLLQGRMTTESIGLQVKGNYTYSLPTKSVLAMEAALADDRGFDTSNSKNIYETANLAVGKLINVGITVKDCEGGSQIVNVPVSVRLSPAILNEETLTHIFTHRKLDTGFVERYHSWRSGRISLIKDMIFCQDLISAYRRAAIKDKSGTLNEIVRRVNNARAYGLLTQNPSLAVASNIYILSKDSAQAIEAKVGQRFNNPKGREKILEDTYAMMICIIDPEWEQATVYFNGIAYPSTISLRAIKSGSKNKGPDVGDIMRSLLEGRAPTF